MHSTVQQEPTLVLGHGPPFGSVVFTTARDRADDFDVVVQDRAEGGSTGRDQFGGTEDGWFVGKVLGRQ
jgi:hypothetical protein